MLQRTGGYLDCRDKVQDAVQFRERALPLPSVNFTSFESMKKKFEMRAKIRRLGSGEGIKDGNHKCRKLNSYYRCEGQCEAPTQFPSKGL